MWIAVDGSSGVPLTEQLVLRFASQELAVVFPTAFEEAQGYNQEWISRHTSPGSWRRGGFKGQGLGIPWPFLGCLLLAGSCLLGLTRGISCSWRSSGFFFGHGVV